MDERRFVATLEFEVTLGDVLDFLGYEYDSDYEPTDEEWLECACELWESDEYNAMFSMVEEK